MDKYTKVDLTFKDDDGMEREHGRNILLPKFAYYLTSCPGAPVAPRHAASRLADRNYGQSRNNKIFNSP